MSSQFHRSAGERFARAVDLIIEENGKPHWAHMIECTAAAVTTVVPAVRRSDATPWFVGREPVLEPATSGAADDRLAVLFDVNELRDIQPALLRRKTWPGSRPIQASHLQPVYRWRPESGARLPP